MHILHKTYATCIPAKGIQNDPRENTLSIYFYEIVGDECLYYTTTIILHLYYNLKCNPWKFEKSIHVKKLFQANEMPINVHKNAR